jgi:hypothetical protein
MCCIEKNEKDNYTSASYGRLAIINDMCRPASKRNVKPGSRETIGIKYVRA